MNCPVCGKEAKAHIYHCTKCVIYVHDKCWQKHAVQAHKKK
jgi:hypothetical protein